MDLTQKEIDKKVNRLSRKTNLAVKRKEISFENQMKKLDIQIQNITKQKIRDFNKQKDLYYDYWTINKSDPSIKRYMKKLNKL